MNILLINKGKLTVVFLTVWLISISVFHYFFSVDEKLFSDHSFEFISNSDKIVEGASEVGLLQTNDTLGFYFELKDYPDGVRYPWADVKIKFDSFVDVSKYDFIEFHVKNSKPNRLMFTIGLNFSDGTDLPMHALGQYGAVDTVFKNVKLPLNGFESREWWLKRKKSNVPEEINFEEFDFLAIGAGKRTFMDEREHIYIHSIKFTKYWNWPYYIFVGVLSVYIVIISILYFLDILRRKRERKVFINYTTVDHQEKRADLSILGYLKENYDDFEISLTKVANTLNISETKISNEIRKETDLTFKQCLNKIRMETAEELLKNSDLKISTIAEKVGYENVTSFNRVFKKIKNMTPSEFRSNLAAN